MKKYDERAFIFNGWVIVEKYGVNILKMEEMKKGVSNYILETQEQLDRLISLNNEIRCCRFNFTPTAPIEVESIQDLCINQDNYNICSKCSFNIIKCLDLCDLSTNQIKFILTRFKRIDKLQIFACSLKKLDLSQSRIKRFFFMYVSFKEPIYLPREIEKLKLRECESPNLIKAQKVNKINLDSDKDGPKEYVELTKTLKAVKVAKINDSLEQYLLSLPSTIRKIDAPQHKIDNLEGIISQFPDLIEVTGLFPFQPTDKSKVRVISSRLEYTIEEYNLRPRKIKADDNNGHQLSYLPEMFEKVEWVYIDSRDFNLDVLSSEIKKIKIENSNVVNLKSVTLNRLEKERG